MLEDLYRTISGPAVDEGALHPSVMLLGLDWL